ncbi:hypothetical protein JOB18_023067 [Solea senegalensis]|uniref:Uncharacterized protein n=1 Tax=Solea senegalensis TaxID=28829 RepID=A0AAV6RHY6_SOLSE|nr:hypothetical protein JOB18_023067 [Solea senegalensis]
METTLVMALTASQGGQSVAIDPSSRGTSVCLFKCAPLNLTRIPNRRTPWECIVQGHFSGVDFMMRKRIRAHVQVKEGGKG